MVFALKFRKAYPGALQAAGKGGSCRSTIFSRAVTVLNNGRPSVCSWFENESRGAWP
jgi:hypothetical protein